MTTSRLDALNRGHLRHWPGGPHSNSGHLGAEGYSSRAQAPSAAPSCAANPNRRGRRVSSLPISPTPTTCAGWPPNGAVRHLGHNAGVYKFGATRRHRDASSTSTSTSPSRPLHAWCSSWFRAWPSGGQRALSNPQHRRRRCSLHAQRVRIRWPPKPPSTAARESGPSEFGRAGVRVNAVQRGVGRNCPEPPPPPALAMVSPPITALGRRPRPY